ncbi:hypothetical protein [Parasutterella excrementihominis]|uniref:hypothetical protein n=1 Tax=Parasutterella excrementihominis TaxID=487175 RepID=UPI0022DEEC21|nr:hypothetical protein [Parasutterella excrementihominis]
MPLAYPDIADMESDGWMIPDGRKITKEEYPELFEFVRQERILIHRRFVVKARQNRLRLYILKALNPYRPHREFEDLINFWE